MRKQAVHIPRFFPGLRLLAAGLSLWITLGTVAQTPWYRSNCPRSQKEAAIWYFGEKAGLDFSSGTAFPLTDQNVMTGLKATGVICDSLGNLQFITDGKKVWDRQFTMMPNATGLEGDLGSTQPCVVVPHPWDSTLYYIFTTDILMFRDTVNFTTTGLNYTVIDMKLRGGYGDAAATHLNVPLLSPVTQKLTAVRHKNNRDFWVIGHKWNSDEFYAWKVSGNGVEAPVVSAVGSYHGGNSKKANNAVGYLKTSPDGKYLASVVSGNRTVELFDFNNETGLITNPRSYTTQWPGISPYGAEFSPGSRFLYITALEIGGVEVPSKPTYIVQFDISQGLTSPSVIDSVAGLRLAALQLGIDRRIYISRTRNHQGKRDSLDVIYNPDRPGTLCNFNRRDNLPAGQSLAGRKSIYSLPNLVQSFVNIPPFRWDSVCRGDVTRFTVTNTANTDSVTWDFGDGNLGSGFTPNHAYSAPGKYLVRMTARFNGNAFRDSMWVHHYDLPVIPLVDTILLYTGSSIHLHAGGGYTEYEWSTGSQDSVITVSSQGAYWTRVKDIHCCENSDTTYVKVFEFFIPNAFSPNGDGLNDLFRVFALYRNISFELVVYDRWGRVVFETGDIDQGWDGTVGGKECPPEQYVWKMTVRFLGQDIITQGDIVKKGTVMLLR